MNDKSPIWHKVGVSADSPQTLRARAEIKARGEPALKPAILSPAGLEDLPRLLHELRVYQIELELQNEELRRTQEALEVSKAYYFEFYDMAPVGYFTISSGGVIQECNRTGYKLLGGSSDVLLGARWTSFVHHDDQGIYHLRSRQVKVEQASQVFDLRLMRRDGVTVPVWIEMDVLKSDGQARYRLTVRDLTRHRQIEQALQESERHSRVVLDNLGEAIVTTDHRGCIEAINPAVERIFGYGLDDLIGRNATILAEEQDRARYEGFINSYLQSGGSATLGRAPLQVTGRHKNGTPISIELTIAEVSSGMVERRFIGVMRDDSERRNNERKLREAQKMEVMGQLTGGMAHDFNNLLAVIMSSLEEVVPRDTNAILSIETAIAAAERGASLTRQLLAFARNQPLAPQVIDLQDLVDRIAALLQRTLGEAITVNVIRSDKPLKCRIDEAQLEAAFLNLALNARDAMSGQGILGIELTSKHLAAGELSQAPDLPVDDYAIIAVSDNGSGMAPEVLARCFDPFFTTKEVGEGSGLGLSMVYGFAKQSGGHLAAHSVLDRGTTFRLYLPISPDEAVAEAPERNGPAWPVGSGELVLVVEDNPEVRNASVIAIQGMGYRTVEAEDAATGLAALEAYPDIAVLFSDFVMPGGLSGIDLAAAARKLRPGLKVLLTSGYTAAEPARNRLLPEDRPEVLRKPYRRAELGRRLAALLGKETPPG